MKPTAYMYTCRNLGQVALKWPGQPAPTGPGWIEVKQTALVSIDQVDALRVALQDLYDETTRINNPQWMGSPMQQQCAAALKGVTP
jgi:hypothetical protein